MAVSLRTSFKGRVLAAVLLLVALLFGVALWIIGQRFTAQVRDQASASLRVTASVFENLQQLRWQDLILRARNVQSDPRFRAVTQVGDTRTIEGVLKDVVDELHLDAALYLNAAGEAGARTGPDIAGAVAQILERDVPAGIVALPDRLLVVAAVPVEISGRPAGALAIGQAVSQKQIEDFERLTGTHVLLFSGEQPVASTIPAVGFTPDALDAAVPVDLLLGQQRSLAMARPMPGHVPVGQTPQFALVSSLEPALRELRATQYLLGTIGVLGFLLSAGLLWIVLGRVTEPLEALTRGAERLGRGDFAQHVEVTGPGEFQALAHSFNEMTDSLRTSREDLEATVAKLRDTRERLLQSEKLSAIGEFVAGVAHELNNPLTVLIGYADLLRRSSLPPSQRDDVAQIAESAERCHRIVQNLLSFARQRPPERNPIRLDEVIEGSVRYLQYELRTSSVAVTLELDPALPAVVGDVHQLQQVFFNLINNARQAIEGTGRPGRIRIATRSENERVHVTVTDDGPGIRLDALHRIFDPFFTTKPAGKGTGLGLSVSYGFIREHGGEIRASNGPKGGAVFDIDLPAAGPAPAPTPPGEVRETVRAELPASTRLLIVDDETAILTLAKRVLALSGIEARTVANGEAAIAALVEHTFDAVLCDWKMPGLSGRDLYLKLLATRPELSGHVVFMSGDLLSDNLQLFARESGVALLAKPFTPAEFRAAVAAVVQA